MHGKGNRMLRAVVGLLLLGLLAACNSGYPEPPPVGTNCVKLGKTGVLNCS
jgi:hypothetical protein